jgi:Zn-dependent membrane protease YugP
MTAFLFFDPVYYLFVTPFLLLALWATWRVKGTFARHNETPLVSGYSGADAAQMIMRAAGVTGIAIEPVHGMLGDHYDPQRKVVCLSQEVLQGRTPAAVAVAAHEIGHVLQDHQGYHAMRVRARLVPFANLGSMLAIPLIIFGAITHMAGLAWLGIIGFSASVLFHLVTLPVEFDASHRAIKILSSSGIASPDEMVGVRKVLYAAGFTYVAAALYSAAELVFWILRSGVLSGSSSDRES